MKRSHGRKISSRRHFVQRINWEPRELPIPHPQVAVSAEQFLHQAVQSVNALNAAIRSTPSIT